MNIKDNVVLGDVLDFIISQTHAVTPTACTETFTISSGCSYDSSHPRLNKRNHVEKKVSKHTVEPLIFNKSDFIVSGGITEDSGQPTSGIKKRRLELCINLGDNVSLVSCISHGLVETSRDSGYIVDQEEGSRHEIDDKDWESKTHNQNSEELDDLYTGKLLVGFNLPATTEGLSDFELLDQILDTPNELQ